MLALASLGVLALLGWLAQQPWFFSGLGMHSTDLASALALFTLVLPVFSFRRAAASHWSRKHEFEADAYAARQADAGKLVSALVKLYRDNASTLTPDPLYSRFHDSHPPAALRIAPAGAATVSGMRKRTHAGAIAEARIDGVVVAAFGRHYEVDTARGACSAIRAARRAATPAATRSSSCPAATARA